MNHFVCSYIITTISINLLFRLLKRLFKDLFERQGFEDDGIFDWDILKKQKEQGSGFSANVGGGATGAIDDEGENDMDKRGGLEAGFSLGDGGSGGVASPRMQSTVVRPSATGINILLIVLSSLFDLISFL